MLKGKKRLTVDDDWAPADDVSDDNDQGKGGAAGRIKSITPSKRGRGRGRKPGLDINTNLKAKRKLNVNDDDFQEESDPEDLLKKKDKGDEDSAIIQFKDFQDLVLKKDHEKRPIWVCPDGHIYLEANTSLYNQAYDFLVAIAEPVSRPEFVHEYILTPFSLYAAVAVSIDTESIIRVLGRLSKVQVPEQVNEFIRKCTLKCGKAKLVLKRGKYYVESPYPEVLRALLKDPEIEAARVKEDDEEEGERGNEFIQSEAAQEMDANLEYKLLADEAEGGEDEDDQDPDVIMGTQPGEHLQNVSFRISTSEVENVKRAALNMDYPLMEEYDFRHDTANVTLPMQLKPTTKIRQYQETSLRKMFGNGRARSGIIVLPCGAGKTLTGVTAASTVKKSTLVLCTSGVSVIQWKYQFQLWTDIPDKNISCFTSDAKDRIDPDACVLITTYSMLSFGGRRAADVDMIINQIRQREWGLMLLDEVHVVPAAMFRKVLGICNAHCKLGLTATLVREDDLISDLNFLIGPKLYEANWMDLTAGGYLANVQCVEAWCPMTAEFYREYLKEGEGMNHRKRELLYVTNPNKFRTCEFLVQYHQERGDKVILFADNVFALRRYSELLGVPYIYGGTREAERQRILGLFRLNTLVNCIGLSKVGDTSIDIPEANVIIQVSSHFGSRRQEAQRLGRILRPKANMSDGFNAFFYTLVSTGTSEMYFSAKRQQYLVDQGYTFKVVADLVEHANAMEGSKLKNKAAELDLLATVLNSDADKADEEENEALERSTVDAIDEFGLGRAKVQRRVGSMSELSGAGGARYMEFNVNSTDRVIARERQEKTRNAMFKMRYSKKMT